jgi:uncharacterized protein YndB with AHSA1/START domain
MTAPRSATIGCVSHVIRQEIVIDAPAEVVWRTITEPDQIRLWFADRVELEPRPGATGRLTFDTADGDLVATLTVQSAEEPSRLAYVWEHPAGNDPLLVEFTLVAEAPERTRLRVQETGLDLLAWTEERKATYAKDHNQGWAFHFDRIQRLLTDSTPR